ncbi:hypothetical protein D3C73_731350 [compost metagenome]
MVSSLNMNTVTPKIYQTDASYIPAELHISTRNPEMVADWTPIWEELGLPRPLTVSRELVQKRGSELLEGIAQKSRDGDRIANISSGEKNVFGNLALERYIRKGQTEVALVSLPSQGLHIDVTIYPPEIYVEVRGRNLK